jgi:hypothetical protein
MPEPPEHEVGPAAKPGVQVTRGPSINWLPFVYQELHRPAHRYMAAKTVRMPFKLRHLLNEVYLRWKLSIANWKLAKVGLLRELSKEQDHGA